MKQDAGAVMKQASEQNFPAAENHNHQQQQIELKRENMEYIASLLHQLRAMAERDGQPMLVYLIEMAEAEAEAAMKNLS